MTDLHSISLVYYSWVFAANFSLCIRSSFAPSIRNILVSLQIEDITNGFDINAATLKSRYSGQRPGGDSAVKGLGMLPAPFRGVKLQILIYYINTNEIPGEL